MNIADKTKEEHLKIVASNFKNIKFVPNDLRKDKQFILKIIDNMSDSYGRIFQYIPKHFNDDDDIGLAIVKKSGRTLEFLSLRLRNDENIVFAAVNEYAFSILHASDTLKNNRELGLIAVNKEPRTLGYLSKYLQDDEEIVIQTVKKDGISLGFASPRLRNNKEIVVIALKRSKGVIQYVSEELRNDKEVALEALKKDGVAFIYFSKKLEKELKGLNVEQKIKYLETTIFTDNLQKELTYNSNQSKKVKI